MYQKNPHLSTHTKTLNYLRGGERNGKYKFLSKFYIPAVFEFFIKRL